MRKKILIVIGMLLFFNLVFSLPGTCGAGKKILLYLPNRILDLLEVVLLGVHVGPGIGLDLRVTRFIQLAADTSADVGCLGGSSAVYTPMFGPYSPVSDVRM